MARGRVHYPRGDRQRNGIVHGCPQLHGRSRTQSISDRSLCEVRIEARTKLNLTRLKTVRERSISVSKLRNCEDTRINDALDMATSPEGRMHVS